MRFGSTEPALFEMRLIEALIAEHQDAPGRSDGLYTLVSGLIPLGTSSDGRLRYCASI